MRQARLNVGFTPDCRLSVAGAVSTTEERSVSGSDVFAQGRRASVSYAGAWSSVVAAAGRVYASAEPGTDTYVLLRAGVPNLAVYAGSSGAVRTGGVTWCSPASQAVAISVDVARLPLEVGVNQPRPDRGGHGGPGAAGGLDGEFHAAALRGFLDGVRGGRDRRNPVPGGWGAGGPE
ncbi:hypothetical protein [Deinococcus soli (ex Cha et al. 2016)]|uniref:hypothetical protein n=1 Tax=Deinococcus soli (ex Cha et al. 2016) TaxID=1309411 RepID=UPI00166580F2|nr:hypothetical protein [Deinococcus soli (ex Cha et al. 2016)]